MNISAGTGNIWTLGRSSWNWATKQRASMCAFFESHTQKAFRVEVRVRGCKDYTRRPPSSRLADP